METSVVRGFLLFLAAASLASMAARSRAEVGEDAGWVASQDDHGVDLAPHRAAWLALPAFDESLAAGEVEIARRPVLWASRRPGWREDDLAADWPVEVEEFLLEAARRRCGSHCETVPSVLEARAGQSWPKDLPAFRAILPGGVEVYSLEHGHCAGVYRSLHLCLRHPASGRLSSRPATLLRRWTPLEPEGPSAWTADLDGDGRSELGLLVTHHNGTVHHGTGILWFARTPDLAWIELRRSILVEEVRAVSHGEVGVIRSRLIRTPEGQVREQAWYENPTFAISPRRVPAEEIEAIHKLLRQHEHLLEHTP